MKRVLALVLMLEAAPALAAGVNNPPSLATLVPGGSITNAMLAGSIAASKLVGTDITTVGTLTAGSINWSGNIATTGTLGAGSTTISSNLGVGIAANSGIRILATGASTTAADFAFYAQNSASTIMFTVRDDTQIAMPAVTTGTNADFCLF